MNFYVLTLFPEAIIGGMNHSIIKRAAEAGIIHINCIDMRDFSGNKHRRVDDYAYGGGPGMVIRPEPVYESYQAIRDRLKAGTKVVYLSPQGDPFNQKKAQELSKEEDIVFICGHYEGIDERVIESIVTDEISIGDFVITGGELGAMVIMDAVSRLIPGVLGKEESFMEESFSENLLEYPHYTRPREFLGKAVPEVLLSGDHQKIAQWRKEQSLERTRKRRPDLLNSN